MKEVLPGIHVWSWFSEEKRIDFNGTYVRGEGESVVIDPPSWDKVIHVKVGRTELRLASTE